jgi:hypothetical protein
MKNKIKEALEHDITEMIEFLSQQPQWTKDHKTFEYEFMVDKDGQLLYEQWKHSPDDAPVDMDSSPLFSRLKDLHYTGVCYVRFHNHGTLVSGDVIDNDDYILEAVLTNSAFHTPSAYYLAEDEGEVNIVFLTEDHPEDDRYFFPLSKDWKLIQAATQD